MKKDSQTYYVSSIKIIDNSLQNNFMEKKQIILKNNKIEVVLEWEKWIKKAKGRFFTIVFMFLFCFVLMSSTYIYLFNIYWSVWKLSESIYDFLDKTILGLSTLWIGMISGIKYDWDQEDFKSLRIWLFIIMILIFVGGTILLFFLLRNTSDI